MTSEVNRWIVWSVTLVFLMLSFFPQKLGLSDGEILLSQAVVIAGFFVNMLISAMERNRTIVLVRMDPTGEMAKEIDRAVGGNDDHGIEY